MKRPKLLMDGSRVLTNYQDLVTALPGFTIAYAMKANPHERILQLLENDGSFFETASSSEIQTLLKKGVNSAKIIFSNTVKPAQAIAEAVKKGIVYQSFDSICEAEKFLPYKKTIQPILRIDVSNQGSLWALNGKFGLSQSLWKELFTYMQKNHLPLAGITFHVGSQCESLATWGLAMDRAKTAILMAREFGLKPDTLNIGGGFPIYLGREVPSVESIGTEIRKKLDSWANEGIVLKNFFAEPGRYICGSAGSMVSHVIGIAMREIDNKLEKWIYLDTGVFSGFMETIDGITYPILSNGSGELEEVMLCGPSCDSADKMFKAFLPSPKLNDTLYFSGAGAYTTVYSTDFNGIETPEIIFLNSAEDSVSV
ncbi:MAG: hypothetical protein ABUK01_02465 [Leptospirales bacterium]